MVTFSEALAGVATFASMHPAERADFIDGLSDEQATHLLYMWEFWRRPNQSVPEGFDWDTWLILAGRGFGKTRTGSETVRYWVEESTKDPFIDILRIALVAETAGDARDVMVEGEAGLLAICPPWMRPHYEPSKRRLTWKNGDGKVYAEATTFAGKEPDQLRGPQFHKAWMDEWAKYQYPTDTIDNLNFGLRLGMHPQKVITTTPRPLPELISMVRDEEGVVVTTGSSYENIANLAPKFIKTIIRKYEGTRLGQQELHAQILDDLPGALWKDSMFRRIAKKDVPEFVFSVVSIDPSVTSKHESNECGIVYGGIDDKGNGFLVEDISDVMSPDDWTQAAVDLYHTMSADLIIGETNNGGDLIEMALRTVDANIPFQKVTATRGKAIRAQPAAALYEQGKVFHVGRFDALEEQLKAFDQEKYTGKGSPDRAEAWIWGLFKLMLQRHIKLEPKRWKVYRR